MSGTVSPFGPVTGCTGYYDDFVYGLCAVHVVLAGYDYRFEDSNWAKPWDSEGSVELFICNAAGLRVGTLECTWYPDHRGLTACTFYVV